MPLSVFISTEMPSFFLHASKTHETYWNLKITIMSTCLKRSVDVEYCRAVYMSHLEVSQWRNLEDFSLAEDPSVAKDADVILFLGRNGWPAFLKAHSTPNEARQSGRGMKKAVQQSSEWQDTKRSKRSLTGYLWGVSNRCLWDGWHGMFQACRSILCSWGVFRPVLRDSKWRPVSAFLWFYEASKLHKKSKYHPASSLPRRSLLPTWNRGLSLQRGLLMSSTHGFWHVLI